MDHDSPSNGTGGDGAAPGATTAEFRERFESLLPTIQREWPEVARHTLEATRGSFDTVVEVIARQTGSTSEGIKEQLLELVQVSGDQVHQLADSLRPLEEQLETLLDDLHHTLRPRIEKPVRERPLMALGIAAGVGLTPPPTPCPIPRIPAASGAAPPFPCRRPPGSPGWWAR
jgi:ElaB/YqjD/DUF883 family membrane-anchored ribosome-binding protein